MLFIDGEKIPKSRTVEIYEMFYLKDEYSIDEKTARFIDGLISDEFEHRYSGKTQFKHRVIEAMSGKLPHLPITNVHPNYGGPYRIEMTGSRAGDFAAANALANTKDRKTPDYYTWHHAEKIKRIGRRYYCDMYLILSSYHGSIKHSGGVKEYEILTGNKYT